MPAIAEVRSLRRESAPLDGECAFGGAGQSPVARHEGGEVPEGEVAAVLDRMLSLQARGSALEKAEQRIASACDSLADGDGVEAVLPPEMLVKLSGAGATFVEVLAEIKRLALSTMEESTELLAQYPDLARVVDLRRPNPGILEEAGSTGARLGEELSLWHAAEHTARVGFQVIDKEHVLIARDIRAVCADRRQEEAGEEMVDILGRMIAQKREVGRDILGRVARNYESDPSIAELAWNFARELQSAREADLQGRFADACRKGAHCTGFFPEQTREKILTELKERFDFSGPDSLWDGIAREFLGNANAALAAIRHENEGRSFLKRLEKLEEPARLYERLRGEPAQLALDLRATFVQLFFDGFNQSLSRSGVLSEEFPRLSDPDALQQIKRLAGLRPADLEHQPILDPASARQGTLDPYNPPGFNFIPESAYFVG